MPQRDISELIDSLDPLQIETANRTEIPYVGWLEVWFKLAANDNELIVPKILVNETSNCVL